jgi:hypothetical protein
MRLARCTLCSHVVHLMFQRESYTCECGQMYIETGNDHSTPPIGDNFTIIEIGDDELATASGKAQRDRHVGHFTGRVMPPRETP